MAETLGKIGAVVPDLPPVVTKALQVVIVQLWALYENHPKILAGLPLLKTRIEVTEKILMRLEESLLAGNHFGNEFSLGTLSRICEEFTGHLEEAQSALKTLEWYSGAYPPLRYVSS